MRYEELLTKRNQGNLEKFGLRAVPDRTMRKYLLVSRHELRDGTMYYGISFAPYDYYATRILPDSLSAEEIGLMSEVLGTDARQKEFTSNMFEVMPNELPDVLRRAGRMGFVINWLDETLPDPNPYPVGHRWEGDDVLDQYTPISGHAMVRYQDPVGWAMGEAYDYVYGLVGGYLGGYDYRMMLVFDQHKWDLRAELNRLHATGASFEEMSKYALYWARTRGPGLKNQIQALPADKE